MYIPSISLEIKIFYLGITDGLYIDLLQSLSYVLYILTFIVMYNYIGPGGLN